MDGSLDGWVDGCMGGKMDGWMLLLSHSDLSALEAWTAQPGQDLVPSAGGLSQEGVSVLASPQGVTASDPREREGRGLGLGTRVCEWGP